MAILCYRCNLKKEMQQRREFILHNWPFNSLPSCMSSPPATSLSQCPLKFTLLSTFSFSGASSKFTAFPIGYQRMLHKFTILSKIGPFLRRAFCPALAGTILRENFLGGFSPWEALTTGFINTVWLSLEFCSAKISALLGNVFLYKHTAEAQYIKQMHHRYIW